MRPQYIAPYVPPISIGTSSEPDWNLIGTSPKDKRDISKESIRDIYGIYQG